jgi:stress-induced morphogen
MRIQSIFKSITAASLLFAITQAWSTPAATCQPIKSGAIHHVIIKAETTATNCFEVIFKTPPKTINYVILNFLTQSPPPGLRLQILRKTKPGVLEIEHEMLTDSDGNTASNTIRGAKSTFFAIQPIKANGSHYKANISAETLEGKTAVAVTIEDILK